MSKMYEVLRSLHEEHLRILSKVSAYEAGENRSPNLTVGLSVSSADENGSSESGPISERRKHYRQQVLLSCIELGNNNGGIVLNISQSGLALRAVAELADGELPKLRFEFSQAHTWVETKGRIVWISDCRKTAGLEFIDLPDVARTKIQTWISVVGDDGFQERTRPAKSAAAVALAAAPETKNAASGSASEASGTFGCVQSQVPEVAWEKLRVHIPGEDAVTVAPATRFGAGLFSRTARSNEDGINYDEVRSSRNARSRVVLLSAVVLSLAVLVFLGYSLRRAPNDRSNAEVKAFTMAPKAPSDGSVSPLSTPSDRDGPSNPSLRTEPSSDTSGFILQVGAMKNEENAISLADVLRQKNSPVYVVKPAADSLYRVFVGPYTDAKSAAIGQAEFERSGI